MKYYSEKTDGKYDSEEELKKAEADFDKKQYAVSKAAEEKKGLAKKVEDSYKHMLEINKQANTMVAEAEKNYYNLRQTFIDKYGSYHMTYSNINGKEDFTIDDAIQNINNILTIPFIW
jgi:hypothetical protein